MAATMTIGITGKMCSGKSHMTAAMAEYLSAQGHVVEKLSVDDFRRYILTASPAHQGLRNDVSQHFAVALEECGALPLDKLSTAVFTAKNGPAELQGFVGAEIATMIETRVNEAEEYALLEWARLVEDGYLRLVDSVVVVHCDTDELHKRLAGSDLPRDVVERRLSLQLSPEETGKRLEEAAIPFRVFDTTGHPAKDIYNDFCAEVIDAKG